MDYEKKIKNALNDKSIPFEVQAWLEEQFPELKESEDERIRKELLEHCKNQAKPYSQTGNKCPQIQSWIAWLEKQNSNVDNANKEYWRGYREGKQEILDKYAELEKQGKSDKIVEKAKIEKQRVLVTESDGSANIDWDTRSLEDARKLLEYGLQYINTELEKQGEQNLVNFHEAEKEKNDFVSGNFIQCRKSFNEFKEGESYWFEYIGDDIYIGRSDNILNKKFHITPRQLFKLFSLEHCYKQEEEQISFPQFTFNDVLALQCCMETVKKVQEDKELYEKLNNLHGRVYDAYRLEKQGEQPKEATYTYEVETGNGNIKALVTEEIPVDNVEPKFKVGDWITFYGGKPFKILKVEPEQNGILDYLLLSQDGRDSYYNKNYVDTNARLWTIQDAKDGDVLVTCFEEDNIIIMYHSRCTIDTINVHCCLDNKFVCENLGVFDAEDVKPATKEQRDTLFAKMKEAGYEWDKEKKELKKIEQKPAWSEEDVEKIKNILSVLDVQVCWDGATGKKRNPYQKEINWLKSIKERYSWKPSEEQMKALAEALSLAKNCGEESAFDLRTLHEQLKKL